MNNKINALKETVKDIKSGVQKILQIYPGYSIELGKHIDNKVISFFANGAIGAFEGRIWYEIYRLLTPDNPMLGVAIPILFAMVRSVSGLYGHNLARIKRKELVAKSLYLQTPLSYISPWGMREDMVENEYRKLLQHHT